MTDRRVVVVSGGSRGLGAALVEALLAQRDIVATFSRRASPFVDQQRRLDPRGESFLFDEIDARDTDRLRRFVRTVVDRFERLDALVNNAAVARPAVLGLTSFDDIHDSLAINLESVIHLSRAGVRAMLQRDEGGSIVNISSIAGLRGQNGLAIYGATKAAVDGLTRGLARELGPRRIRVNSVAPGFLATEMSEPLAERQRSQILRRTPLGRLGTVDDVVETVRFLISPAASFITGQTLVVDGGLSC